MKAQKKTRSWIFFLGLVDPSRNRLALTAYFAIILGGFCPEGFLLGVFDRLYKTCSYVWCTNKYFSIKKHVTITATYRKSNYFRLNRVIYDLVGTKQSGVNRITSNKIRFCCVHSNPQYIWMQKLGVQWGSKTSVF